MKSLIDKQFKLSEHDTSIKTEVIAGIIAYCDRKGVTRMSDFIGALDTGVGEPDVMEAAQ